MSGHTFHHVMRWHVEIFKATAVGGWALGGRRTAGGGKGRADFLYSCPHRPCM